MKLRSGSKLGGEDEGEQQSLATTAATSAINAEGDKHRQEGSKHVSSSQSTVTLEGDPLPVTRDVKAGVEEANNKKKKKAKKSKKSKKNKHTKPELKVDEPQPAPPVPTNQQHSYNLRQSASKVDLDQVSKWKALRRDKSSTREEPSSIPQAEPGQSLDMSRNRPRGPPTNRDNGIAANEEIDMWNKIIQDIRKANEKNDKQKAIAEQISALNEKIAREGNSKSTLSTILYCGDISNMFRTNTC
jgi:SAGA-associated factor 29